MAQEQPKEIRPEDALQSLGQAPPVDPAALLTELSHPEQAPPPISEQDLAAALDAKAFRAKMGHEDALEAMAKGEWKEEEEAPPPADDSSGGDSSAQGQATILQDAAVLPPSSRPGNAGILAAKARAAQGDAFKKFSVPLLLVTGILLWLLGGGVAMMSMSGRLHLNALKIVMVVSAFPLGAFLILGAWIFHRDANR